MTAVIISILVISGIITLTAYACCVVAGRADDQAEEYALRHSESASEKENS